MERAATFTDVSAYLGAQKRRAALAAEWEGWPVRDSVDLALEPTLPILPYDPGPVTSAATPAAPGTR